VWVRVLMHACPCCREIFRSFAPLFFLADEMFTWSFVERIISWWLQFYFILFYLSGSQQYPGVSGNTHERSGGCKRWKEGVRQRLRQSFSFQRRTGIRLKQKQIRLRCNLLPPSRSCFHDLPPFFQSWHEYHTMPECVFQVSPRTAQFHYKMRVRNISVHLSKT